MNVQRFTGRTNKLALEQVREALGPDALILSNKRTAAGIEICAMLEAGDMAQSSLGFMPDRAPTPVADNEIALAQLKRELTDLRETLQSALGERRWQDSEGKRSVIATVEQRLATLGLARPLIGDLVFGFANDLTLEDAWQSAMARLVEKFDVLTPEEQQGLRIKAIVGSGVERSSVMERCISDSLTSFDAADIAVISMANMPSGALGQFCHDRGVVCYSAPNAQALKKALVAVGKARQIFIDTPDLSPSLGSQDPVISALINQRAGLTALLVLPATANSEFLDVLGRHAMQLPLAGALVTQLEDAIVVGGVIDTLVSQSIALAGVIERDAKGLSHVTAQGMINEAKRSARRNLNRKAAQMKVAV